MIRYLRYMLKSESVEIADVHALSAAADQYNLALSKVIDQRMRALGLTYRDLAERAVLTETTLWNRLKAGGFRPDEQYKVAGALDTTVSVLTAEALNAATARHS